ncbi:CHAP domain-containing protein [Bifidobacterium platyrrhinorum]|uniref:CHAP domain-containing protein n=1 Tax=Bifidobacterium platyrrhinorum TaxID=2661628 RepID=A0A6L9SVB4_9BIFI|nr:CHAP domain-containing protein [Bifidobacterium platyrrhinorum]NEG55803.1 CHAP domain-containing protein [Bifidobacterium platyrrhinorum]
MRHAAHKAARTSTRRGGSDSSMNLFSAARGSHTRKTVLAMQMAEGNGAVLGLEPAVAQKLNEIAPMTRRSIREAARAAERRNFIMGSASLAALAGTAATAVAFANPADDGMSFADDQSTTTTQIQRVSGAASRSDVRTPLTGTEDADGNDTMSSDVAQQDSDSTQTQQTSNEGSWSLGDANTSLDSKQMSRSLANNENVAKLMDQDGGLLPAGFDPNHATGDIGNAYEFSQCTWWVYVRRHELGLPVGSHMGNGNMWANSARALGYWVDNTPRHVGDIMVFRAGQEGTDSTYGHVAIVEKINADGSIVTSECGSVMNGKTYSKTYTNVSDFEYIHY